MNTFEELFDDLKGKAKTVYGTASKMTSDAVDIGKVRYQIKQTQWEIEKTYARIGAVVYESKKGGENLDDVIALAIAEVDAHNERLEELERRLRSYKRVDKCPACGKENDVDASFCSRCGATLVREQPVEEPENEGEE
ncbi:MAG: zinc ribbon domain-containing protein [Oscillospiraceae bacterium]|nr:zinc ribbon domain-containing protein [Oscillospiraceae bacterium]